jgi:hypothetical protein
MLESTFLSCQENPLVAGLAKLLSNGWAADPPARGHLFGAEAGGL